MWKIFSKVIFHITIDEISLFPTKKRGGGGVEPFNRDSVRDISKLVARVFSLQRSGTKGEALSPLIFLEKSNIYSKYWVSWRVMVTFKSSFYYFFVLLRSGNSTWASLTRERYFQHSKIKFVSPRGHVISSIYALILVKKLTNICESNCLSTHICDPPQDFRE